MPPYPHLKAPSTGFSSARRQGSSTVLTGHTVGETYLVSLKHGFLNEILLWSIASEERAHTDCLASPLLLCRYQVWFGHSQSNYRSLTDIVIMAQKWSMIPTEFFGLLLLDISTT